MHFMAKIHKNIIINVICAKKYILYNVGCKPVVCFVGIESTKANI